MTSKKQNKEALSLDILMKITEVKNQLPKKQIILCNYILENYQDIQVSTVKTLANKVGVGTTTVLRLVENLGYKSYTEFKMEFYKLQNEYISRWDKVQDSFLKLPIGENKSALEIVWNESIQNLTDSLNPELILEFTQVIKTILNANRLFIDGSRPYKAAAIYFDLLLSEFASTIIQLSNEGDSVYDKILRSNEKDCLIVFSFEPYTKRSVHLAEIAATNGTKVVAILDSLSSPIAQFANHRIKVRTSEKHFSIIPIFALLEALVLEIGKQSHEDSINTIQKLEPTLRNMDVII